MKWFKNPSILIVTMMILAIASSSIVSAADISWRSYDEGISLAKSKNKKIYVNFYADWCGYCKKMDKETFTNQDVVKYLNDNYITVRLNSDKEPKLARQFNVQGLPANVFMSEKGEPIGNQPGYMGPKDFMDVLKFVHDEKYKKR